MGAKFGNLNVRGAGRDDVELLCPGLAVDILAPGWVTVAGHTLLEGEAPRLARRLSKSLGVPVMAAEYFDDDFLELGLYRDGRTYGLAYARGRAWTRGPKDSPPYTVVERPDCLRLYELLRK